MQRLLIFADKHVKIIGYIQLTLAMLGILVMTGWLYVPAGLAFFYVWGVLDISQIERDIARVRAYRKARSENSNTVRLTTTRLAHNHSRGISNGRGVLDRTA